MVLFFRCGVLNWMHMRRSIWRPLPVLAICLLMTGCSSGTIAVHDEPAVDGGDEDGGPDPDGGDPDQLDGGTGDDGQPLDAFDGDDPDLDGGDSEPADEDDGGTDAGADDEPDPPTELLLFDGAGRQFTYADSGFHVLINPGDPLPAPDWLAPVDFYEGEFQVRYVIEGPADQQPGKLQTCLWTMGDDGVGGNYFPESCGQQVAHAGPGTYLVTNNLAPSSWWKNQGVPLDYAHPERFLIRVVLRGESGCNVTRYDVNGACWDEWPLYENMTFRVTIVLVGAGETFSGWGNYP